MLGKLQMPCNIRSPRHELGFDVLSDFRQLKLDLGTPRREGEDEDEDVL